MRTVKEIFRDAIKNQDWEDIRLVYKAITNEEAPEVETFEQEQEQTQHPTLMDILHSRIKTKEEEKEEEEEEEEEEEIDTQPSPANDFLTEDFSIQHGTPKKEDGEICRKEPMTIPKKRVNIFNDDGKAFQDERIDKNPDNPTLGIKNVTPRDQIERLKTKASKIEVTCGLCGAKEVVSSKLAHGFNEDPDQNTYRCNNCSSPKGKAKQLRRNRNL